jgi:hypothetical protein
MVSRPKIGHGRGRCLGRHLGSVPRRRSGLAGSGRAREPFGPFPHQTGPAA